MYQGLALSALLFVIVMEALLKEFRVALWWELLYADDVAVIAETKDDLIKRLREWNDNVEKRGMRVNINKTKVIISGERQKVTQKAVRWPSGISARSRHTQHNHFMALWILSGTTRVSRYQKKHSPTHTHRGHQSSYLLSPSTTIPVILPIQSTCFTVFFHNLCPSFLWSTSWPGTLHFILHTFLHPIIIFFSQHMPIYVYETGNSRMSRWTSSIGENLWSWRLPVTCELMHYVFVMPTSLSPQQLTDSQLTFTVKCLRYSFSKWIGSSLSILSSSSTVFYALTYMPGQLVKITDWKQRCRYYAELGPHFRKFLV